MLRISKGGATIIFFFFFAFFYERIAYYTMNELSSNLIFEKFIIQTSLQYVTEIDATTLFK